MAVTMDLTPILSEMTSESSVMSLKFSELVFKKYTETRSILEFNDLKTGIKCNSKIPFADLGNDYRYMKSKEALTSQCDFNECDVNITFSTKTWQTHAYNCQVSICRADLDCEFESYFGKNCQTDMDKEDLFIQFLVDYVTDKLVKSHWVKTWFTGSSYNTSSDLYGSDGLFVQMLAAAPVGSSNRIEIPENSQPDYASQMTLDPERGFKVYSEIQKRLLKNRSLRGIKGLVIHTTEDLAINYMEYLQNNNQVNCCYKADVTQSIYTLDSLNIFGIPIKVVPEFDDIIQGVVGGTPMFSELNNGTVYNAPHRAFVTYKENIPAGTCDSEKLQNVELLYDPYKRTMNIRTEYEMGSALIKDEDLILAM